MAALCFVNVTTVVIHAIEENNILKRTLSLVSYFSKESYEVFAK